MAAILQSSRDNVTVSREFVKLATNPMFADLRATLITDLQQTTKLPSTLISKETKEDREASEPVLDPALVAVQEANLQSDFQQILPTGNSKVHELQSFYSGQCDEIEHGRCEAILKLKEMTMMSVSQFQKELANVHLVHDRHRMHLTNRVTASLQLLKVSLPCVEPVTSTKNKRQLNSRAVAIMNDWYEKHIASPYPTDEEKMALAEKGQLTLSQVKAWFANKRNRTSNTKPKRQKTEVEKQLLDICYELSGDAPQAPTQYGNIIRQLSDIVNTSHVFNPQLRHSDGLNSSGDESGAQSD